MVGPETLCVGNQDIRMMEVSIATETVSRSQPKMIDQYFSYALSRRLVVYLLVFRPGKTFIKRISVISVRKVFLLVTIANNRNRSNKLP